MGLRVEPLYQRLGGTHSCFSRLRSLFMALIFFIVVRTKFILHGILCITEIDFFFTRMCSGKKGLSY